MVDGVMEDLLENAEGFLYVLRSCSVYGLELQAERDQATVCRPCIERSANWAMEESGALNQRNLAHGYGNVEFGRAEDF